MRFLDHFKKGRLRRFSGTNTKNMNLSFKGEEHNCVVRWTYHGNSNTFDKDFVGLTKDGEDIWYQLSYQQQCKIDIEIQKQIVEWARSVGIKHPYL